MFILYLIVVVFLLLLLLIHLQFRSRDKNGDGTGRYNPFSPGDSGEFAVARQLRRLPDKYFVINDLLFRNDKGHTTQIDHIVVSPYGIFVIETKNISGNIYGSENVQKWTRYLRTWWYGVERTNELSFQNPIQQNQAHIEALKKVLRRYEYVEPISLIAFSPKAELHIQVENANITYWSQVRRFIKRYDKPILTIEETNRIYEHLRAINIKDKDARDKHVSQASINQSMYVQRVKEALAQGKCPKCGGQLVKRNGRHGEFYGCSNYPTCKYTHPI